LDQHLIFLLLGLANGAVFAFLALALVVTYRSSGVINFATGAIAMCAAYVYAFLRQGKLLVLIPGLPRTVDLPGTLSFWPALVIAVGLGAVLGLVLYGTTFRPLRVASPVAKAVASLGIMILLTGLVVQRVSSTPVVVGSIFPTSIYTIGSVRVSADRLWFAATVVIVTIVISATYRFTRFGLHTRAAAETEKGAYVCRISPDRIAATNWMISGAVAALAGVLIAPISPLVPYSYTLFIVPALAAAVAGGFQRLGVAVGVGLAIGVLQSEMTYLQSQHAWLPASGLPELVPLALILIVLVVRAKPLPSRGALLQAGLGLAPRPRRVIPSTIVGFAAGLTGIALLHGSWREALLMTFIFGVISLSSVVVTGFAGQVSLAQLTLAGVAAFLLSPLTSSWGVPFPLAPVLAALAATVVGVVVGLPALRIRGLPVAVVTLSLAAALEALWFKNTDFVGSGGKHVSGPTLFGLDLRPGTGAAFPRPGFCIVALLLLVVVALGVARLRTTALGSAMLAVRANERSAASAGISVLQTKLAAFAIAAFIAGLGGAMLGYKLGTVTYDSFTVLLGIGVFASAYLAGITSISGGMLAGVIGFGGLIYYSTTQWFGIDAFWYQILTGLALVVNVVKNPEGIMGSIEQAGARRRARRHPPTSADTARFASVSRSAPATSVAATTDGAPLLRALGITVRYGGVLAVDEVGLDVAPGTITGLIGPNGAGKTTLIDALSGCCPCNGTVELAGRRLDDLPPHRRVRAGLGRTFQGIELWNDLTVGENVLVGHGAHRRDPAKVGAVFDRLGLGPLRHRLAGELSQGQRQLVSIARSLVAEPQMLLLDEPAAGLDSTESAWLAERLRDIRAAGTTILLVDHDMGLVLNLCDRVAVLDVGRVIAYDEPAVIRRSTAVADAYLGSRHGVQAASP
jgi:ABC-type branched-subunit amino acid transport system ATPase component/branched-subunit amino acid ABC-type transport system permease component